MKRIPKTEYNFGDKVLLNFPIDENCSDTIEAYIIGIKFNPRRDKEIYYTIMESDGTQTDEITDRDIVLNLTHFDMDTPEGMERHRELSAKIGQEELNKVMEDTDKQRKEFWQNFWGQW